MAATSAEVQDIIKDVRSYGFQVEISGKGAKVYKDGKPVPLASGAPATIHLTPSDARWKSNLIAEFRKARILPEDYGREGQQRQSSKDVSDRRNIELARAQQVADAHRRLEERVKPLAGRLSRIIQTLDITAAELARLAIEWGEKRNKRVPKNANAAAVSLARILRAEGSTDWMLDLYEGLADDLEGKTRDEYAAEKNVEANRQTARIEAAKQPLKLVKDDPLACEYPNCDYVATTAQGKAVHQMSHRIAVCPECVAAGAEKTTYKANAIGRHRFYAHGVRGESAGAKRRAVRDMEEIRMSAAAAADLPEPFADDPPSVAPADPVKEDVLETIWQAVGALRANSLTTMANELRDAAKGLARA